MGRDATPTADRVTIKDDKRERGCVDMCFPFSPNTCTKRSEAPFTTAGIFSKSGAQFTNPVIYAMTDDGVKTPCRYGLWSNRGLLLKVISGVNTHIICSLPEPLQPALPPRILLSH